MNEHLRRKSSDEQQKSAPPELSQSAREAPTQQRIEKFMSSGKNTKSEIGKVKPRFNIEHVENSKKNSVESPTSHHNRSFETAKQQGSLSFC